jgi:outer membrane protein TolC
MSKRRVLVFAWVSLGLAAVPRPVAGQPPTPTSRVTFKEAIDQAIRRNPSVQQAADEILRAAGLLRQATAVVLPSVGGSVVNTTLNTGRSFGGVTAVAQDQATASLNVSALLYAPVEWAQRVQAADNQRVAELAAADIRRQIGVAAAQAYLAIIARRRVLDADTVARDTARAHYELSRQLRESGAGSRLNELRAQQALSSDEALVEESALGVYGAQEALGVLLAADGPLTVADEPTLDVPATLDAAIAAMPGERTDLRLAAGRQQVAARVVSDSWKDWLPSVSGLFQPQYLQPETIFSPAWSWRAQLVGSIPIFDSGFRRAVRAQREAVLDETKVEQDALLRQARSDVRTAQESAKSAERALASARAAADQAHQVVEIVNVSFRAGASTNIEVIDAQRAALDADTAVAIAEDQVRQARLALLVALGRFP